MGVTCDYDGCGNEAIASPDEVDGQGLKLCSNHQAELEGLRENPPKLLAWWVKCHGGAKALCDKFEIEKDVLAKEISRLP